MDVTSEQLRDLVFTAEQEHKYALGDAPNADQHVPEAKRALLQLQSLLSARAAQSPALRQQTVNILEQCTAKLHILRVHASKSETRKKSLGSLLAKAGCPNGFQFTNPKGFNLLDDLNKVEPFKQILQATPASQKAAQACARIAESRALAQRNVLQQPSDRPHAAGCGQEQAEPQQQQRPLQQQQQRLSHVQQLPQQPEQRPISRSSFQVPPPPRSGGLANAAAALRHHPTTHAQQQQQQPQQPQQGSHPQGVEALHPHHPQQHPQQQGQGPAPTSADAWTGKLGAGNELHAGPNHDSRWNPKVQRRAQDAHVHHARQQQQGGREDEVMMASDEEESNGDQGLAANHSFQSAKSKLIADMRKAGQPYNTSLFSSQQAGAAGLGPAARQGLTRPGGGKPLGSRRPMPSTGQGGVNKGFVPPFVKKALDVQNGGNGQGGGGGGGSGGDQEAEGPLSLRTREFLRLGPEDPLPEELAKLDPQLIEQVCNDIVETGRTSWEAIAGQEVAKKLIQEVVVWPLMNPTIFTGARAPPRGILLFGPPGTGKTLLGKAIASNINATFFSISASSLTSKWIGEGEKMVRTLFAVAGWVAPSVIFIDEIDSLLSARKSEGEHEASRRLKTEMLVQMEGCDPNSAERRVLLIGATNRPEELDEAARRRMPKQLYIPLPDPEARRGMVLRQLGPGGSIRADLSESDVVKVVKNTDGYSGSDMKNLIQEACQGPVRDAVKQHGSGVAAVHADDLRPVVLKDFQLAARAQKASVEPSEVVRYEQYNEKHGAKILAEEEAQIDDDDDW